jgi:hypothetical protein
MLHNFLIKKPLIYVFRKAHFTLRMAILNILLILHHKDRKQIKGFIRSWVQRVAEKIT